MGARGGPPADRGGVFGHRRLQGGAEGRGELGSARAPKAGSVRRRTITFSSEDSQWSFWNWSKLTADKSSVATTARRQNVYLYAYMFVADCPPLLAFARPCNDSLLCLRIMASPTPSKRTPAWRTRRDSWAPAAIICTIATIKLSTVDLPRTESDRGKSKLTIASSTSQRLRLLRRRRSNFNRSFGDAAALGIDREILAR